MHRILKYKKFGSLPPLDVIIQSEYEEEGKEDTSTPHEVPDVMAIEKI